MVSTSARNAGDPWFDSRSRHDRLLYANSVCLYIYISHQYIHQVLFNTCSINFTARYKSYSYIWLAKRMLPNGHISIVKGEQVDHFTNQYH